MSHRPVIQVTGMALQCPGWRHSGGVAAQGGADREDTPRWPDVTTLSYTSAR
jgi:hypothetical protein